MDAPEPVNEAAEPEQIPGLLAVRVIGTGVTIVIFVVLVQPAAVAVTVYTPGWLTLGEPVVPFDTMPGPDQL